MRLLRKAADTGLCILMLSTAAGCADFDAARHKEQHIADLAEKLRPPSQQLVASHDVPYLIGEPLGENAVVPDILKSHASIMIARPVSLRDAAIVASQRTGIPVSITPDAEMDLAASAPLPTAPSGSGGALQFDGVNIPPPSAALTAATPAAAPKWSGAGVWLDYHGSRLGVFQAVAARFGISQRYEDGQITFFRTQSKTFIIPAFNDQTTDGAMITAYSGGGQNGGGSGGMGSGGMGSSGGVSSMSSMGSMGGSSGSSGGGSSTGATTYSHQRTNNRWENLSATAQAISGGAIVRADRDLGTLTVVGTPSQVQRVAEWVKDLSDSMMRQVAIDVRVYTFKATSETNYGFQPKVAASDTAKTFASSMVPAAIPTIQSTDVPFSFGASILDSAKGAGARFKGTELLVQALSELGNLTQIYDFPVVTTNGMTVPFQNGENDTYLQSSGAVLAANAGAANTLQPGVVMSGFSGKVTPRIVGNKIILQGTFTLQSILGIGSVSSGNASIQTPKTASTAIDSNVVLRSGETLTLTGYMDDSSQRNRTGAGSPFFWLFGGGGDAQNAKSRVIVTVEAHTI